MCRPALASRCNFYNSAALIARQGGGVASTDTEHQRGARATATARAADVVQHRSVRRHGERAQLLPAVRAALSASKADHYVATLTFASLVISIRKWFGSEPTGDES